MNTADWIRRAALLALLLLSAGARANENKSGVSPSVLSLPTGPGSVSGLGESFQPSLNTGTGKHSISLAVPVGPAGHQPALALVYDGGEGNSAAGLGWSLPVPFVQRQTDKGVPRYIDGPNGTDDDGDGVIDNTGETDHFIDNSREELVPVADGPAISYFHRNEGAFLRYRRVGTWWEARTPDGDRLVFGETAAARISDPAQPDRIFRWLLERQIDTRGNTIRFRYASFPGAADAGQKYLAAVEYGAGPPGWSGKFHFLAFEYEPRADFSEDCRPGFSVFTGRRLVRIHSGTQGVSLPGHLAGDFNADGLADALNRRWTLTWQAGLPRSLLAAVTVTGSDAITALPAAQFTYTQCLESPEISAAAGLIAGLNEPPVLFGQPNADLADLNGDGLPDLLHTIAGSAHRVFYNRGETTAGGTAVISWSPPEDVEPPVTGPDPRALGLDQDTVLIADADGDAAADLVQMTPLDTFYFKGTPAGPDRPPAWGARHRLEAADYIPPSPFGASGSVRTADIDADGRTDIVRSSPSGSSWLYHIWLALPAGGFAPRSTHQPDAAYDLGNPAVQIADMNGDRLADIAWIRPAEVRFTASHGRGIFGAERVMPVPDVLLDAAAIARASLRDLNGDGLADLVVDRAEPNALWFWPNRGNFSFGSRIRITGLPVMTTDRGAARWADLNGNGTLDFTVAQPANPPGERILALDIGRLAGCVPRPWLLRSVSNGIGRVETISYGSSTEFALTDGASPGGYRYPWPHPLPFPVTVIRGILTVDGMGHSSTVEFRYHDGFYDADEKQFRGFARVERIEAGDATAPSLLTTVHFDTGAADEARKGRTLRSIASTLSGEVFTDKSTTWRTRQLHAGLDGAPVAFASMERVVTEIVERGNGAPARLQTETDYDSFGNLTLRREYGRVIGGDPLAGDDQRQTQSDYVLNLPDWIIRLPRRMEVRAFGPGGLAPVISRKEFFYDDETFSGGNFGSATAGFLTMSREWPDPSKPAEFIATMRQRYDAWGNVIAMLDPLHGVDPGHWREVVYDPHFRASPEQESVHTGAGLPLTASVSHDYGLGVITAGSDFNGHTTTFAYDPLGRLTAIVKPGDTAEHPTARYAWRLAQPAGGGRIVNSIETSLREDAGGGTHDSRQYMDGLGRIVMHRTEGEAPGQVVVSGFSSFNARQLAHRSWPPWFETGGLEYADPPPAVLSGVERVDTVYDAAGRAVLVTQPPETAGGPRRSARNEHRPLATLLFDEEDNNPGSPHWNTPHWHRQDGLGRLVGVDETCREDGVLHTYSTSYSYDALDSLVRITDSRGNAKLQSWDGLGRLTFIDDPDRGVMHYSYDAASNLVQTTDAKNQRIVMTWDGANRILAEDYLDPRGISPDVSYLYDQPVTVPAGDGTAAAVQNARGRLVSASDLSGGEVFSYDARGLIEWKVKQVPHPANGAPAAFRTGFTYDSIDRLRTLDYPDGDRVTTAYNSRNLPETISGGPGTSIVDALDYTASGQLSAIRCGNGVTTDYGYDPRRRLASVTTAHAASQTTLVAMACQFDGASNITRIDDLRTGLGPGDPRRNTQIITCDNLYRVTGVTWPAVLNGGPGTLSRSYDSIGNLLRQTCSIPHVVNGLPAADLGDMTYGGTRGSSGRSGRDGGQPGPHALTGTQGGGSLTYDANGNMESIDGMSCTWDFKDRLVAMENAQMRAEYTYDYADRRVAKKVSRRPSAPGAPAPEPEVTLYIDRTFELRPGMEPVKYVWNGDTRVARITSRLSSSPQIQRIPLSPGWNVVVLTVSLSDAHAQILGAAGVTEAVRMDPATGDAVRLVPSGPLPAGTVLRLHAASAGVLAVRGARPPPLAISIPAGRQWVPNLRSTPVRLAGALPPADPAWFFYAKQQAWHVRSPLFAPLDPFPDWLEPGEALFTVAAAPWTLPAPQPALDIRYYHGDHLGSVAVVTDASGALVSETATYPFGQTRNAYEPRGIGDAYGFAQKERDAETGLADFGARHFSLRLGRFTRVDPVTASAVIDPQRLNAYSYANNSPFVYEDPGGQSATLIGAVTGGIIGGAVALWKGESTSGALKAAASGALAGAAAGLVIDTGGAALGFYGAAAASGAAGGLVGGISQRALDGKGTTLAQAASDTLLGAAGGVLGAGAGKVLSAAMSKVRPLIRSFGNYSPQASGLRTVSAAETGSAKSIATPYGAAVQSELAAAQAARSQVSSGSTLYRVGSTGRSAAGEAQFWALEHPSTPGFASRYGIPAENVAAADFIERATLRPGSSFITRPAPGIGGNPGGGIEVVVPSGGVRLESFHYSPNILGQ